MHCDANVIRTLIWEFHGWHRKFKFIPPSTRSPLIEVRACEYTRVCTCVCVCTRRVGCAFLQDAGSRTLRNTASRKSHLFRVTKLRILHTRLTVRGNVSDIRTGSTRVELEFALQKVSFIFLSRDSRTDMKIQKSTAAIIRNSGKNN